MTLQIRSSLLFVGIGFGSALLLLASLFDRPVAAQATPAADTVIWDYNTSNIEHSSLQAKLTELGNEGWQVFSIVNSGFTLDQSNEAMPRLVVQRVEVSAKRIRAK